MELFLLRNLELISVPDIKACLELFFPWHLKIYFVLKILKHTENLKKLYNENPHTTHPRFALVLSLHLSMTPSLSLPLPLLSHSLLPPRIIRKEFADTLTP